MCRGGRVRLNEGGWKYGSCREMDVKDVGIEMRIVGLSCV